MEAVTSSWPPAGAPTLALVVWIRPDVQEPPWFSAVMSRLPLPSRWTLLDEFVMVSISPVPKLEPGPVSYCHADDGPLPAPPLKSSLNTVDQPEGGPGTAAGAASAANRAPVAEAPTAAAAGPAAGSRAMRGAPTAAMTASRRPVRREVIILDRNALKRKALHCKPLCTRRSKPVIGRNLHRSL